MSSHPDPGPLPSHHSPERPVTERMAGLVAALAAYVTGRSSALPRLGPADAVELAETMHAEMDRGTTARARVVDGMGRRVVCQSGCAACCEALVLITEPEALVIARWLMRPENQAARAAFETAYPRWRQAAGDMADRAAAASREGKSTEATEALKQALAETVRRRVMCAFNQGGMCTIYPVRPNLCRQAHALDTPAACHAERFEERTPEVFHFVPLEEFRARLQSLMGAAHRALRGPKSGPEPLCDAVHRLLDQDPALTLGSPGTVPSP